MHLFETKLVTSWTPLRWQDVSILLAVSGGADSLALLRAIHRLKTEGAGRLLVAHFNHRLRGEAADVDEAFVEDACRQLGVELHIGRRENSGESPPVADEDSLRTERYNFLQSTAERTGARYVVTAHTADDQVETILHRILRGTGLRGLVGIPRSRPLGDAVMLIRPMLRITRYEVLDYLRSLNQPFREDTSNLKTEYTRNRIRHELLPLLAREYNANIGDALLQIGQLASDAQSVVAQVTDNLIESHATIESPTSVVIDCGAFTSSDRPLVRELLVALWRRQNWPLVDMGFREWNRLAMIAIANESHIMDLPGSVRAQKKGESLSLTHHD